MATAHNRAGSAAGRPFGARNACTCSATPGRLCGPCTRWQAGGWPSAPQPDARGPGLSAAERERLRGGAGNADLFEPELIEAKRVSARTRNAASERYEALKGDVRRKAKNPAQYERRIKAAVKRIRY